MNREVDAIKEELDRRFTYLREDFRRELAVLKEDMERLAKEQATTDKFLRGGNGSRGLAIRLVEVQTNLQNLERRLNRGRAKGWAVIIVVLGSVAAALKKLVGAAH